MIRKTFIFVFVFITFIITFSAQVAVFYSPTSEKYYTSSTYKNIVDGLINALEWGKIEYSIVKVTNGHIPEDVKVLIDPSNAALNDSEVSMIKEFLTRGGKVLAAYESGLRYADGKIRPNYVYGDFFGIKYKGWLSGGYNYMKLTEKGKEIFGIEKDYIRMPRGFTFVFETPGVSLANWTKDESGTPSNPNYPVAAVVSDSGIFFGENIYLHTGINDDFKAMIVNSIRYLLNAPVVKIDNRKIERANIVSLIEEIQQLLNDKNILIKKSEIEEIKSMLDKSKSFLETEDIAKLSEIRKELEKTKYRLSQSYRVQTRAMWLDHGAILRTGSPDELRKVINKLNDYGFNVIFPEVIYKGTSISSKLSYFPQDKEFANWKEDPFDVIIEEAHKLGMEVHAWCWVFAVAHGNTVSPLMEKYPQWLEKSKYGTIFTPNQTAWFSHANPEARNYLMNGIIEVIEKYKVDGVNLDYIRYDSDEMGFDEYTVKEFTSETGINPYNIEKYTQSEVLWQLWREEKVNSFVKEFYEKAKTINPELIVSADVFPSISGARMVKKQNWEDWLYNGYIDVLIPMNYFGSADDLKINLENQLKYKSYIYFYPGLQLISLKNTEEMLSQVYPSLEYFNQGIVLFSLAYLEKFDFKTLKDGLFRFKAVPTHSNLSKIVTGMEETLLNTLDILKEYGLSENEYKNVLDYWSEAKTEALNNQTDKFFDKIVELFFYVSEGIEEPIVSLKLADTINWMLEIIRPRILKGTEKYEPTKPEGMIVIENAAEIPEAKIQKSKIKIDGDTSDWQNIRSLGMLKKYDSNELFEPKTEVKVCYDEKNLYVLFICEEDDFSNVTKFTGPRDTRTYLGDSVEFFILKDESKKEYYHFVIGIDGTLYDETGYDSKWNGQIEYITWSEGNKWYVEMAVNLEQFNLIPEIGKYIKVNFNRNRWRGNKPQYSGWSVTYGSYHTIERFGKLIFEK